MKKVHLEQQFLGKQTQMNPTVIDHIALNACGFWTVMVAMFLILNLLPDMMPPDAKWLKTLLHKLLREYADGGVTRQTILGSFEAFILPERLRNNPTLAKKSLVRASLILC